MAIPLDPGTGGHSIGSDLLIPADLIVSTTGNYISKAIREFTGAEVSHSSLYLGSNDIIEAVREGVVVRSVSDIVRDYPLIVVFRHSGLSDEARGKIVSYAKSQRNKKYNVIGLVQEMPVQACRVHPKFLLRGGLMPGMPYGGVTCVALSNVPMLNVLPRVKLDQFFCSQLIFAAYQHAGVPLSDTDPTESTPGEIPTLALIKKLDYVGHLRA
jgi:uncharacterized protein YycO